MPELKSLTKLKEVYNHYLSSPQAFASACHLQVQLAPQVIQVRRFADVAWDWQWKLLAELDQHNRIVILKARQLGLTWLMCIYALYTAFARANAVILMLSTTEREAKKLLSRIEFIYDHLPKILKDFNPITSPHSKTELGFLNGSTIIALPATEKAGRSYTANLVVLDEFAFYDNAERQWASVLATVERGKLVIVSTANGMNNKFYEVYDEAKRGLNGFKAFFFPYNMHPDRNEEWYEQVTKEMKAQLRMQEYPRTDVEAFTYTGDRYFSQDALSRQKPKPELPYEAYSFIFKRTPLYLTSAVKVYELPVVGHQYGIGVDTCSAATSRSDNAAVIVVDAVTGEQVFEFAMPVGIDVLFPFIVDVAEVYPGVVVVERNGVGIDLIRRLEGMGVHQWRGDYTRMLGWTKATSGRVRIADAPGIAVTATIKDILFSNASLALENGGLQLNSYDLLKELSLVPCDEKGRPKPTPGTAKDDRVMALVLAWAGVAYLRQTGQATAIPQFLVRQGEWSLEHYLHQTQGLLESALLSTTARRIVF